MTQINEFYSIEKGITKNNIPVTSLYKIAGKYNGQHFLLSEPEFIRAFYGENVENEIKEEIELNNWKRELFEGQKVQISENIYYHLLNCLPPRNWQKSYFEVGEPHHHKNGKAIHRACWIENGKYFTGYPKVN